jgi:hypothetical protein
LVKRPGVEVCWARHRALADPAARQNRGMSAPNVFYQQHYQVEAPVVDERHFRTAWKILTRLDGLLVEKWITTAEFHAAADFRELY